MKDQIYSNILTGYASEKEKKDFYEELGRDEKKQEEFIRLKRLWDLSQMAQNTLSSQRKKQLFREFLHAGPPQKKTGFKDFTAVGNMPPRLFWFSWEDSG
ncbi:MAG: hypothetical protein PHI28_10645 [Mangrovibacterium sp.]|nr:hypothetical protein [Mangrovibacterium sp.]